MRNSCYYDFNKRAFKQYSLISDEQKKLYNDMMKKTRERETELEKIADEEAKAKSWF